MKRKIINNSILLFLILLMFGPFITSGKAAVGDNEIGHNFNEKLWAVSYDFTDQFCKEDLTGDWVDTGFDNKTEDKTGYIVYINQKGIEMAYIALEYVMINGNIAWMPYQTILQHWKSPDGTETIATNNFAGLVAYDDKDFSENPSKGDDLYIGWTLYQNNILETANEQLGTNFNKIEKPEDLVNIIQPEKDENGVITFGIEYNNIITIWQGLEKNTDDEGTSIVSSSLRAISLIDHLKFLYKYEVKETNDRKVEAIMSVTYDIGQMRELIVMYDNEFHANRFGGTIGHTSSNMSFVKYETIDSIKERLDGSLSDNISAMGISLIQYMNTFNIDANAEYLVNLENEEQIQNVNIIEELSDNIDEIGIHINNEEIFKTDFTSKKEYSLYKDDILVKNDLHINSRLVEKSRLKEEYFNQGVQMTSSLANIFINHVSTEISNQINPIEDLSFNKASYLYLISFPEWSGLKIIHDPVFITYGLLPILFPWNFMTIGLVVALIGLISLTIMIYNMKKKIDSKKILKIR